MSNSLRSEFTRKKINQTVNPIEFIQARSDFLVVSVNHIALHCQNIRLATQQRNNNLSNVFHSSVFALATNSLKAATSHCYKLPTHDVE